MKIQLPWNLELHIPVVGWSFAAESKISRRVIYVHLWSENSGQLIQVTGMSFCCNFTWRCHMSSWCCRKQSCSGSCYTCTVRDCVQLRPLLLWGFLGRLCGISTASLFSVLVWNMSYVVIKDLHKITIFPEKEVHYIDVVMLCTTWR